MGKKTLWTPRSRVRSALRQVFLRSRERAAAIKRENNTCECCGRKGSVAKGKEVKIEAHHIDGIEWEILIDQVYKHLLCPSHKLKVVCKECHKKEVTDELE